MLAKERQSRIHTMLRADGAVTTSNLVDLFGVSLETIRRDFLVMAFPAAAAWLRQSAGSERSPFLAGI